MSKTQNAAVLSRAETSSAASFLAEFVPNGACINLSLTLRFDSLSGLLQFTASSAHEACSVVVPASGIETQVWRMLKENVMVSLFLVDLHK